MKIKSAVGAALLGLVLGSSGANALDTQNEAKVQAPKKNYATEYGRALPPVGFVGFCGRNPAECEGAGRAAKLAMTRSF